MFTAVCVTLRTVAAVVPILIFMLLIHFVLVMTARAGPAGGIATGMTCATIVIGPTMPRGEAVIERGTREGVCIVTLRTLSSKVVGRWRMAR